MINWKEYVRNSYELVVEAEKRTAIYLHEDVEYYLVRLMAKWFDHSDVPPDTPVAIMLMSAMHMPGSVKEMQLQQVGEACLFIDGFGIKQRRWPSQTYYKDMGRMAFAFLHTHTRDDLYGELEYNFPMCSAIIKNIRSINS